MLLVTSVLEIWSVLEMNTIISANEFVLKLFSNTELGEIQAINREKFQDFMKNINALDLIVKPYLKHSMNTMIFSRVIQGVLLAMILLEMAYVSLKALMNLRNISFFQAFSANT